MKDIQLSDHFTIKRLLRYSLPSVLMMIFTSIYSVVDGFFVSNFVGKTSFAAVNFIMPVLIILGAVGFMLGSGGSALIGKLLGEGRSEEACRVFSMMIAVSVVTGIVLAVLGMIVIRPAAKLLGADDSLLLVCVQYGRIILIGLPALMLQYEFQSFFVTAGKPQLGLYITVASGVMNMVLDGILVGVLSLGIPGAASATVISMAVGGLVPVIYFSRRNSSLLRIVGTGFDGGSLLKAISNGSSEFVSDISMSVVGILYNSQLMKYSGQDGVAAYGVLMYVSMIFTAVFIGYSVGTAPIVSFHYGAGDTDELRSLLRKSLFITAVFSVSMLVAGELLAGPLSAVFVGYDKGLVKMTVRAFRIFSFSFLFCGIPIFASSFFTALNDGFTSAAISFLRTIVFQVAAVIILPMLFGLDGIWYSLIVAELTAAIVAVIFLVIKGNVTTGTVPV
ncbi:MAG: MATE family efflux transporter [Lachnospiraceae bacterium]|nr:MATE family efflux transporter [Lachnospiraceae bacterium]